MKNKPASRFVSFILLAIVGLGLTLLLGNISPAHAQTPRGGAKISDSAARQIRALEDEKKARTPAQQKIDSQLLYEIKKRRHDKLMSAVPSLSTGVDVDSGGRTVVDITARIQGSLLEDLKAMGAEISYVFPQYNCLRATVGLDELETIAGFSQVKFIMPKQEGHVWGMNDSSARSGAVRSHHRVVGLAPDFPQRAARVRAQLAKLFVSEGADSNGPQPQTGSVNSEGDTTHKANTARSTFGANGAGVRIGVLSDGVASLATSQASGDLGPVTVLPGQTGTGDEGTAMLEIVHDLAPGAELYFATAFTGIGGFAQNIRDLRSAGCDIIIDDVFYYVESPLQDGQAPSVTSTTNGGLVTQAVNDVTAADALYFSSAGNQGNKDDNTSSCYQGDFVDGGTIAAVGTSHVHDFGGGAQSDLITQGSGGPINLYWSDPLGGSNNDYDLYVLNNFLTVVREASTNIQNGTQDPFEQVSQFNNNTNYRVVVARKAGAADRFFYLTTNANGSGKLGTSTEGATKGHSMSSLAYSVAATPALSPGPFPNPHSSSNVTEKFSSDGPRRIFFAADGTPFTPGNFSSTGGILRQKPDITAADKVSVTGAGGFGTTFYGTSAAAPHAGAIAGLLRSAFPTLTPALVRRNLTSTAIDIEAFGVDRDTGAGIVMPLEAIQSTGGLASANFELGSVIATETCCNGNSFIEPGETGSLSVSLKNTGAANATAISATLTTTTPNVVINTGTSAYPDMSAPAGTGTNSTSYSFSLDPAAPCDLKIDFILTITYTGGNSPKQVKFSVQTGRPPVSVTTTMDATAPPASPDYLSATTGTQTNRVINDGRASTATFPKTTCPGVTAATNPRFDAYEFTTCAGGAPTKTITVTLSTPCPTVGGGTSLFSVTYYRFVPSMVCANYIADGGAIAAANGTTKYSFNVPAGLRFTVVVSEVPGTPTTSCNYTLTVSGQCLACPTTAPIPSSAVSRKIHGANPFDVPLPLSGTPGIECRSGGGTNDYQMVVSFPTNVTVNGTPQAQVTTGTGQVGSGGVSNGGIVNISGGIVTVPLTNIANVQTIKVTLFGVNDGTNVGNVVIPMGMLVGDTTANGSVNSSDISQTKAQSGTVASASNFRTDVTVNGSINSSDISTVKSKSGTALPP